MLRQLEISRYLSYRLVSIRIEPDSTLQIDMEEWADVHDKGPEKSNDLHLCGKFAPGGTIDLWFPEIVVSRSELGHLKNDLDVQEKILTWATCEFREIMRGE